MPIIWTFGSRATAGAHWCADAMQAVHVQADLPSLFDPKKVDKIDELQLKQVKTGKST